MVNGLIPGQAKRLAEVRRELRSVRWFSRAGEPDPRGVVADSLSDAWDGWWDGWNSQSDEVWRSERLAIEANAEQALTEDQIDEVFDCLATDVATPIWDGLGAYLARHRDGSGVADAIAVDLYRVVVADAGWIALASLLEARSEAFSAALSWYQRGRRLCGWRGGPPSSGRPVLL